MCIDEAKFRMPKRFGDGTYDGERIGRPGLDDYPMERR